MNCVTLIGRLTKDPELSYTPNSQTAVAKFNLAVDKERKEDGADYIRITVFGKQAENCDRWLGKGSQVGIKGRIQTGSYKNKDGQTVYTTDVIADRVEFLGGGSERVKREEKPSLEEFASKINTEDLPDSFSAAEDDIPF